MSSLEKWKDLDQASSGDRDLRLLENIDELVAAGEDEDETIARFPEALRDLFVLSWLDFEHTQGGLATYFFNSHGRHARLAAEALGRIGATTAADALEAARVYVDQHAAAWSERHAEFDQLEPGSVVYPFVELDGIDDELEALADRFDAALDAADWGEKLDRYLAEQLGTIIAWAEGRVKRL